MIFLDEANIILISGRGGSGAVSFHREKFVPKGGPDGADGGHGGSIYLLADRNVRTLFELDKKAKFEAEPGDHGVTHKRGKSGKDLEIRVPVGTIVSDTELAETIVDMDHHGKRFLICKGGKAGKGNLHFANSVRQAPNYAQKGGESEVLKAHLELKLIADVGLVGLPNAGKSTLISQISSAKPKIADYPFTTLVPNLGVVSVNGRSFVVADTPGLIEGAAQGIGLGHQFLRHVERNRVLVHVLDVFPIDGSDPVENFHIVENELKSYSSIIEGRPRIIALNKMDLLPPGQLHDLRERLEPVGFPIYAISAATGQGLEPLVYGMLSALDDSLAASTESVVLRPAPVKEAERSWWVTHEEDGFTIHGKRITNLVSMTDLDNEEALFGFQRRLKRIGIIDKLIELGVEAGNTIRIGELEFEYSEEEA